MKKQFLYILALAPLFFTACSSEDDIAGPVNRSTDALDKEVSVTLNTAELTRTTISTNEALDNKLNNVCFVFFDGDQPSSKVVSYQDVNMPGEQPQPDGSYKKLISTTSKARYAVALANVTENYVSECATLADVLNTKADIRSTGTADGRYSQYLAQAGNQFNTGLPMFGTSVVTSSSATFNLVRKVARVRINVDTDFSDMGDGTSFTPTEIFMHNFWSKCVWNATTGCDSLIKTAESINGGDYIIMSTGIVNYSEALHPEHAAWATFYTLPWEDNVTINGVNTAPDMQVVIKGNYGTGTHSETIYYPVALNGGVIKQNNAYIINITIKGKGVEAKDINDGPLNSSSNIRVNVNVVPWTVVDNIDKTIE